MNDRVEDGALRGTTWYGLPYVIRYGEWCDLEVAGVPMPHPSLINAVIRRGLDDETKRNLVLNHERGHLETLPFVVPYLVALFPLRHRSIGTRIVALVGLQAFWELLTESYVVASDPKAYWESYGGSRNPWPYWESYRGSCNPWALLFWPAAVLAAVAPFRRRSRRPVPT